MALNNPGTIHRSREQEEEDSAQISKNIAAESWKTWPNEAAFDHLEEHRGPLCLTLKGSIPSWAAGALFRTGPGQSRVENTSRGTHLISHWFDGFAQTHRFDIIASDKGGETQVWYSSRRQAEEWVESVKKKGWRSGITFGQKSDPCVGIFSKMTSHFEPDLVNQNVTVLANIPGLSNNKDFNGNAIDNGTTNQVAHRANINSLFTATDFSVLRRIDQNTLESLGQVTQSDLHPSLSGPSSCAHTQRDPLSGDLFNYNLKFGRVPTYRIFRVDGISGKVEVLAKICDLNIPPAYVHSFFLTENFVVLCIPSAHYAWSGLKILWKNNLIDSIRPFDKSKKCKWLVIDRRNRKGLIATFSTPAAFFFHSINAFEERLIDSNGIERTEISCDLSKYQDLDIIKGFYYDVILDRDDATRNYWLKSNRYQNCSPAITRYRFRLPLDEVPDLSFTTTAEEVFSIPSPHAGDLPTIHPLLIGSPYRFVYSGVMRGLGTVVDALVKTDVTTGDALIWNGLQGHTPGEPVFVPRPGSRDEDDGVVLSVVVDGFSEKAYLLCLDGKSMKEIGRAEADFAIGLGFHGVHLPVTY